MPRGQAQAVSNIDWGNGSIGSTGLRAALGIPPEYENQTRIDH